MNWIDPLADVRSAAEAIQRNCGLPQNLYLMVPLRRYAMISGEARFLGVTADAYATAVLREARMIGLSTEVTLVAC